MSKESDSTKKVGHKRIFSSEIIDLRLPKMAQSVLGVGSSAVEHFDKPEIKVNSLKDFQRILDSGDMDLQDFKENMSYSGFDKERIAKMAASRLGAMRTSKLVFLAAMRGTNLRKIVDRSVSLDGDVKECYEKKKILSNGTGPDDLTMGRLIAVFPEIAAYYMIKCNVPKKLSSEPCPAALQFPGAAALPMSQDIRVKHISFSFSFSKLISSDGNFDPTYYRAAFQGQQPVARLSRQLRQICGEPTDEESRDVNIDVIFESLDQSYISESVGKREPVLDRGGWSGRSRGRGRGRREGIQI
jgi:hypothetical protein